MYFFATCSFAGVDIFTTVSSHGYGEGPNEVFLYLNCTGSERRINECSYTSYPSGCSHANDAGVVFWPGTCMIT